MRSALFKDHFTVALTVATWTVGRVRKGSLIASAACVGDQTREEGERVAPNLKIDYRAAALGAHFGLDNESDPADNRLKLQNEKKFLLVCPFMRSPFNTATHTNKFF